MPSQSSDTEDSSALDDPKCYICLCERGEDAPYCNEKESQDFIKPCKCSLVAHRKCFLSWVSSLTIPKVVGTANERNIFGIQFPLAGPLGAASAYHASIFELFTGAPHTGGDKMCVFVDCPQCRRRICLSTPNSSILNFRRFIEQFVDNLGSAALLSGGLSAVCMGLIGGALLSMGMAGQVAMDTLASPSVQLGLYGVSGYPKSSVNDALESGLIPPHKFVSVTCFMPVFLMWLNSALPYGAHTDFVCSIMAYSMFSDPTGAVDTVPCQLMRQCVLVKTGARILYNLGLNRIYYHWHKNIQPCFFAQNLSADDLQRIEDEIEGDMERENKEEMERANDTQYSWPVRFLRKTVRKVGSMFGSLGRQLLICNRLDFSSMFDSNSWFRRIFFTSLLPKAGELVSTHLLSRVAGLDGHMMQWVNTPNEEVFLRNIVGCVIVMLAREVISFGLNYIRYRQLTKIDVDKDPSDYARYVADLYRTDANDNRG